MKTFLGCVAMTFGMLAGSAQAEQMITVDGQEFPLSTLMATCQNMTDQPVAQIACFSDLTKLLDEQSGAAQANALSVPDALEALRAVAQYRDEETGLTIAGSDCNIQVVYYGNYFHISRRNISALDLFSARFSAAQLQYDQMSEVRGAQVPLVAVTLDAGAAAAVHGGIGLDSAQQGFEPRSPRTSLDAYALEVINQLPAQEGQSFEFVLVHPQRSGSSAEIWSAFEDFIAACRS